MKNKIITVEVYEMKIKGDNKTYLYPTFELPKNLLKNLFKPGDTAVIMYDEKEKRLVIYNLKDVDIQLKKKSRK